MKTSHLLATAILAVPAVASANVYYERTVTSDGRIIEQRVIDRTPSFGPLDSAIHSGAANPADDALAHAVARAIAAERAMEGATVTVTARDGRVNLSGSAQNLAQAHRAEQVAREVAGVASVSGTLDPQGN